MRAKAVGDEVLTSLTPDQHVVRIVRDEMLALFGDAAGGLPPVQQAPRVILMLGLQGSGKTTIVGEAGAAAGEAGAARDARVDRRAAAGGDRAAVGAGAADRRACARVRRARWTRWSGRRARWPRRSNLGFDTLIVDTAGRLHIDDDLMGELEAIKAAVEPTDLLYVADAMTGQDAVKSAGEFHHRVGTTGVVLTKMDGDARGGAALSVVGVVGVPIAFVGTGERLQDLEAFQADRLVSRMLGMGDVLSLIERAEEAIDDESRERLEKKTRLDDFTLEDFRDQLRTIKKMGPLEQVLGMIPGLGELKQLNEQRAQVDDKQLGRVEAIINSMTAARAPEPRGDQRQPPQAHRAGQRDDCRGRQSRAQAVRRDAQDAQGHERHGRRSQGPSAADGHAKGCGRHDGEPNP